jgi:hypothetical protein
MSAARVATTVLLVSTLLRAPVAVAAAPAQGPDLATVLGHLRQQIQASDFRATGRLVRVAANGDRTNYKVTMKAHWFPDGLRLLSEITGPAAEHTKLLLHMTANGHVTIDVLQPGSKAPVSLLFEHWNDPLLGTDFSYEDMVEGQFFWKTQELLPAAKYGARDCFVLKSAPGGDDRSFYESVTSWIDRDIYYPVHVLKVVRASQQQKDFTYFGLRQTSGIWSASQVEVKVQGKPGSSLLIIERGSAKAKLQRKDFDIQAATQGEQ